MTDLTGYDSIDVANLPDGGDAYFGYTSGDWPTWDALKKRFEGKAHLVSIAIDATEHALMLDIEDLDAKIAQAPGWVRGEHARNVPRPILYASVSKMDAVLAELRAAAIERKDVRLVSAHYDWHSVLHPLGKHICGPQTCGLVGVEMDGTQWTDSAAGANGSKVDEYVLLPDFFPTAPPPPPPAPPTPVAELDGYVTWQDATHALHNRGVISKDGGQVVGVDDAHHFHLHLPTMTDPYLASRLDAIEKKLGEIMTAQDDVNAAVAALQAFLADLGTAVTAIQAELANVAPQVDTSALNALVAQLPAVQASVDALEAPAAAPAADAAP